MLTDGHFGGLIAKLEEAVQPLGFTYVREMFHKINACINK